MGNTKQKMAWAQAGITPTQEVLEPVMRSLHDLPPEGSTEGAREVAQLAAWRAAQEFAFEPVMEALTKLRERTWDPDQPFMLTDSVRFSWKTAPIRKYASFEDFYQRELEPTWGRWSDLQETWRKVAHGEITPDEGKQRVLGNQGAPAGNVNAAKHKPEDKRSNVTFVSRGNSVAYREAKGKRDRLNQPAPYYREKALTTLRRAWKRASTEEREAFLREVT